MGAGVAGEAVVSVACPYCGFNAKLVTGAELYPRRTDLAEKRFWLCAPCGAWVGTHAGSERHAPLGRLANAELRRAKQAAHAEFDPIWMSKEMSRSHAYKWLADQLGVGSKKCHIGMFDVSTCERVVAVCRERREVAS